MTGNIEGLEPSGKPSISWKVKGQEKTTAAVVVPKNSEPFDAALSALHDLLKTRFSHIAVQAIAHRVVHGGTRYLSSVRVTPEVLTHLAELNALAPLHQPHNLAGIHAFSQTFPHLPQIACFDTAFHRTLSPLETTFAIDKKLTQSGVRRFGFHGLSYQFLSQVLEDVSPKSAGRTVMAHLGNGASLCATVERQSCATTMGFSALDGLMMGSRSGALDPGVLLYLMEQGWSHDAIQKMLYKQSGLLGVSGEDRKSTRLNSSHT